VIDTIQFIRQHVDVVKHMSVSPERPRWNEKSSTSTLVSMLSRARPEVNIPGEHPLHL